MGEDLQKRLAAYLDAAERGIREAGPAVGGELEALVREWLAWEFWSSVVNAAGLVAVWVVWVLVARALFRAWERVDAKNDPDDIKQPLAILAAGAWLFLTLFVLVTAPMAAMAAMEARHAVKVWLAPRVVIVEKVADLAKSARK